MPAYRFDMEWFADYFPYVDRGEIAPDRPLYVMTGWPGPARPGFLRPFGWSPLDRLRDWLPRNLYDTLGWAYAQLSFLGSLLVPPSLPALGQLLAAEWLLHVEPKGYRDHVLHSLMVAVTGHYLLLRQWPPPGGELVYGGGSGDLAQVVADSLREGGEHEHIRSVRERCGLGSEVYDRRFVLQTWWTAALFHDIGYAHELASRLQEQTASVTPFWPAPAAEALDRYLEDCSQGDTWPDLIQPVIAEMRACGGKPAEAHAVVLREMREAAAKWHAPCGALLLLAMLEDLHRYCRISQRTWLIYHLAARAILQHDLRGYARSREAPAGLPEDQPPECLPAPTFGEAPLSFLLILVDHIENWGRVAAIPTSPARPWETRIRFRPDPIQVPRVELELDPSVSPPKLTIRGERGDDTTRKIEAAEAYRPLLSGLEWKGEVSDQPPAPAPIP